MVFVWWFFRKRGGGWGKNYISFTFPLHSLSSHYQKVCRSCIYPSTTTSHSVCVRTMYCLSFFFFFCFVFFFFISAVRVQARTQRVGAGFATPSWANYFKLIQFSPETEFTLLILASKSEISHDSHPLCKNPLFRTPFFESLCTDLEYILSKSIVLSNSLVSKEKSVGVSSGILTTDTDTRITFRRMFLEEGQPGTRTSFSGGCSCLRNGSVPLPQNSLCEKSCMSTNEKKNEKKKCFTTHFINFSIKLLLIFSLAVP